MTHQDDRLRGPAAGAPRRAPRRRTTVAWVWLMAGVAGLLTGIVIGHGLLIAAGLVAAGVGGQLFDPGQRRRRRPGHHVAS